MAVCLIPFGIKQICRLKIPEKEKDKEDKDKRDGKIVSKLCKVQTMC